MASPPSMEDGDGPFNPFDVDSAMDLDLDPNPVPSRPARFQPKLKCKFKSEDQEPKPKPTHQEQEPVEIESSTSCSASMEIVAVDEDVVVREIDVFCNPCIINDEAQLYVMQYPLRPSWRPYDLEERCEEVRLKPKHSEVEVVLGIDVDSENYDKDVAEPMRLQKQTLSSSRDTSRVDCAVGILMRNQLHLNPVHAVLRLLPSMEHINDGGLQKKQHKSQEAGTKSDKGKSVARDLSDDGDDTEPWVSLEYNAKSSTLSCKYQQEMTAQQDHQIDFMMKPSDYVNSLCPGTSTVNKIAKMPSKRFLVSEPLEERLKEWLRKGCQVNRFDALVHLDSTASKEVFLKMLRHAYLVQGVWVSRSSFIYEGRDAILRDYILFLFSNSHVIQYSKLKELNLNDTDLRRLLRPLAYERPSLNDWKFKEERDSSFIKGHLQIVKEQECAWSSRGKQLEQSLFKVRKALPVLPKKSPNPIMAQMKTAAHKVDTGSNRSDDGTGSTETSLSNETRESLSKALLQIFSDKNARSINSIRRELQDLALSISSRPKEVSKTKTLVSAVTTAASGPSLVLMSVLDQVAVKVHNVYVLKSGENPTFDPLRNVIIRLFCGKESNAKLKKQEIMEAAKTVLKRDIPNNEYNQVVNELCIHSKGAWVLRSAGNPV